MPAILGICSTQLQQGWQSGWKRKRYLGTDALCCCVRQDKAAFGKRGHFRARNFIAWSICIACSCWEASRGLQICQIFRFFQINKQTERLEWKEVLMYGCAVCIPPLPLQSWKTLLQQLLPQSIQSCHTLLCPHLSPSGKGPTQFLVQDKGHFSLQGWFHSQFLIFTYKTQRSKRLTA